MQIGQKIIRLDSVDSTNNYAANLLIHGELTSGTVIMADEQFAGKGQRGAAWTVKSGENLTFSFFLGSVNLSVDKQFFLTQFISVVLVDFLSKFGITSEIKWPNDIYANGKKIAGVLIENQLVSTEMKSSIIGIGLNINQSTFEGFDATSMANETGRNFLPVEILFSFIEQFNSHSSLLHSASIKKIEEKYLSKLFQLNRIAKYEDEQGVFSGEIMGVNHDGRLIIRKDNSLTLYDLKEIKFLLEL